MSTVRELVEADFEQTVFKSGVPVFVDFYGDHCAPCTQMEPAIQDLAREYEGEVEVYKVNRDKSPLVFEKLGIRGIPMFALYKDSEQLVSFSGVQSRSVLFSAIDEALDAAR